MLGGRDKKAGIIKESHKDHTLIAKNAEIVGDIKFSGGLHIQGKVTGNVIVSEGVGELIIGDTGVVVGEIRSPHVVINGQVDGDVHSTGYVELAAKAVVSGNVYYKLMEMVKGAQVNGSLEYVSADSPKEKNTKKSPFSKSVKEDAVVG